MPKLENLHRRSQKQEAVSEQKQFEQQLLNEFNEFVQKVPPIERGFSDNPKEILKIPTQQRAEALIKFKDTLLRQREAMAECRLHIEKSIAHNSSVSKEFLMSIVNRFAKNYGFSTKHQATAEYMIDRYYEMRHRALEKQKEIPDNKNLVFELTGLEFDTENITITVPDMSIDIIADKDDIAKFFQNNDNNNAQYATAAFASIYNFPDPDKSVYYTVSRSDLDKTTTDKLLDHEHAHHKHKILNNGFSYHFGKEKYQNLFGANYATESLVNAYKKIGASGIEPFLQKQQMFFLNKVKDEIIAKLQNNTLGMVKILTVYKAIFSSESGNNYDFAAKKRTYLQKTLKNDMVFQRLVEECFIYEYEEIIEDAFQSFYDLTLTLTHNSNTPVAPNTMTPTAIALLTDVPLQNWTKTVNRLLEGYKTPKNRQPSSK